MLSDVLSLPHPPFSVFTLEISSLFKRCKNCQRDREGKFSTQHLEDLPEETKIAEVVSPTQSQRDGWEPSTEEQHKAVTTIRNESPFRAESNVGQRRVSRKFLSILLLVYFLYWEKLYEMYCFLSFFSAAVSLLQTTVVPAIMPQTTAQENTPSGCGTNTPNLQFSIKK